MKRIIALFVLLGCIYTTPTDTNLTVTPDFDRNSFTIRPYNKKTDRHEVDAILNHYGFSRIDNTVEFVGTIQYHGEPLVVAFFALYTREDNHGEVCTLCVKSEFRRNKFGSKCMDYIKDYFSNQQVQEIVLTSTTEGSNFYPTQGFVGSYSSFSYTLQEQPTTTSTFYSPPVLA